MMGDDLTVVNAARVSFNKKSDWEYEWNGDVPVSGPNLSKRDQRLINYLAKHNHWTPFSHVMIQMRETVPIFVARQRFKHMVGFTYNEVSRRYDDSPPEFYIPKEWRKSAENKKQGSSDETIDEIEYEGGTFLISKEYQWLIDKCFDIYTTFIATGVAPEQARMVLPQSMYTSYYVTGSLAAWARAYKQRIDEHAQQEIQDLALQWGNIIGSIETLSHSWKALTNE
jgi:thymidylate synthase (FAD)